MVTEDFALTVERLASGTTVLVLAGEVDRYRAPEIEHALAEAIDRDGDRDRRRGSFSTLSADARERKKSRRVVVDLCAVTFLDSTMLTLLFSANERQRSRGGELLVLVGPETPTTALEVTGFDRLLTLRRVGVDPRGQAA